MVQVDAVNAKVVIFTFILILIHVFFVESTIKDKLIQFVMGVVVCMGVEICHVKSRVDIIADDLVIGVAFCVFFCCERRSSTGLQLDGSDSVIKFWKDKQMERKIFIDRAGIFFIREVQLLVFIIQHGDLRSILCIILRNRRKPFFLQILVDDPDEVLCRNIKGFPVKSNIGFAIRIPGQIRLVDVADKGNDQAQQDDGTDDDVDDVFVGQFFCIHDWPPLIGIVQCASKM